MTDRFRYYDRTLRSTAADISAAVLWIQKVAARHGMAQDPVFKLELCASELLANVAEHAYRGDEGDIHLQLFLDQDTATLTVVDSGPAYDPGAAQPKALPASLADAGVGGLGIHLVRQFADSLTYERSDHRNRTAVRIGARALVHRIERRRAGHARPAFPLLRADGATVTREERRNPDRRSHEALFQTALFRHVTAQELEPILVRSELRSCAANEVLFRAGEYHRCVLLTLEGRLRVHLENPDSDFFMHLEAGESVGELSVADGKPVSAWIVADTPCRLLVIPEPVFLEQMLAIPRISRNVIVLMSERMRRNDQHIVARVRAAMELEALQRELDLARQIQSSMLPVAPLFRSVRQLHGHGFMRAARQVGGDFYDALTMSDGRAFAAIGDVCNKGTPAALFMVRTLTVLRSEVMHGEPDAGVHLARLAARCNDLLIETNEAQQFVTLFCAIFDSAAGQMHYVNAGHNPPLLRSASGETCFLREPRNPLAGIVPQLTYSAGSCEFPPGSLCLLYTDGVTEAENSAGELFGDDALLAIVGGPNSGDPQRCVDSVVAAVDAFAANHPQTDDITLLAIHRP